MFVLTFLSLYQHQLNTPTPAQHQHNTTQHTHRESMEPEEGAADKKHPKKDAPLYTIVKEGDDKSLSHLAIGQAFMFEGLQKSDSFSPFLSLFPLTLTARNTAHSKGDPEEEETRERRGGSVTFFHIRFGSVCLTVVAALSEEEEEEMLRRLQAEADEEMFAEEMRAQEEYERRKMEAREAEERAKEGLCRSNIL